MLLSFKPMGDGGVQVAFESVISPDVNKEVTAFSQAVKEAKIEGMIDLIPAFCTLLVHYDSRIITYDKMVKKLKSLTETKATSRQRLPRVFEIPVVYGGEKGPDLLNVANHAGCDVNEVINRHSQTEYLIYMLGFMPGFPYLGGLDARIATPRLATPRIKIPKGSVGIGGDQTGIYPLESPGGWQLIGQTPLDIYNPNRHHPILFEAGDYIKFVPIDEKTFDDILALVKVGRYEYVSYEKGVV